MGAIAEGTWKPRRWLDLFFRYDNVQIDDPWTIPGNSRTAPSVPSREIAYTFQNRGKAGFRLRPRDWLQLSYDFTADSFENASFRGRVQRIANTVSVSLTPIAGLTAVAGYTHRDLDTSNLILIAPRYLPTTSLQDGDRGRGHDHPHLRLQARRILVVDGMEPGLVPIGQPAHAELRSRAAAAGTLRSEPVRRRRVPRLPPSLPRARDRGAADHVLAAPLSRNDYDATIVVFRLTRHFDF